MPSSEPYLLDSSVVRVGNMFRIDASGDGVVVFLRSAPEVGPGGNLKLRRVDLEGTVSH